MNTYLIYSAIAIVCLIVFGVFIGYYQSTLYINENKLYLFIGIICLGISAVFFYYAYEEYRNIGVQKEEHELKRKIVPTPDDAK